LILTDDSRTNINAPTRVDPGGGTPTEQPQKARPLCRSANLDRFAILAKLGEGGMAAAELDRMVAMVLRDEFRDERQSSGQARLLREAQAKSASPR